MPIIDKRIWEFLNLPYIDKQCNENNIEADRKIHHEIETMIIHSRDYLIDYFGFKR